ncbi:MAG: type II toxin-antitoxin system RelE/ParE family toxin [Promethearchaeota archaeon]|nr:MAG: type II toxin-antitoxin system RelE/ParE family toxin [Candidatus Lokiarchaeota archaeon]TFG25476.1 MAG: type II toxin-antitoxin system RelE/ParE family toxin [Candidatus Lokiarchaeota archaeon]
MVNIRWTTESEIWLKDIHEYISKDDKEKADSVINGIYNKAQLLLEFPKIGQRYKLTNEGDVRILLYGHYRIVYILKNKNDIDILGVFHGSLDLDRYLHLS